ncbi:MAG: ABC transporter permease [SAR202 cluster bacterium]|uniref:Dipeptide transport system permease protein DppB (TC 3.A.1.5.2) n=2 Tax=ecological metagenomes TaxID=410657 RepID=A0A160V9F2_9ZZZZ|nr:ABC transporter permease [Dehalococcoidia bacterium]MEC9288826.1 ABC transporter permease [Chloroflexota bacterium]MQF92796.1 ABC transporter permease [SAR202 cluster bacterium]MCH2499688.1 ABC transporter permease [Dehalococcoidia bacterium]MEE3167222.1 ABC transporter permease [Chloroflexota bacterium]
MGKYVLSRLAWLPVILLIVSFITFALGRFGPGDPVEILMGQYNDEQVIERIREQRGFNDPIFVQYGRYIKDVLRGDFGESFKYRGRTVSELLKKKMWVSAQLNIAAISLSLVVGIPLGLFAALRQGTLWDTGTVAFTLLGQSIPVFLTAPVVLLVFALKLDILPTHGWGGLFDTRVILPAVVMGVPGIAIITRLTRASTLEVISQDYIRTARAKGLSEFTVQRRHVLRNAMIPVITMLGFSLAGIAFTSFIVERFFGIPGIGNLFIESIFARDFPIINAVIIIGTTMFVAANLIVDMIYPWLDPRIRLGGSYAA